MPKNTNTTSIINFTIAAVGLLVIGLYVRHMDRNAERELLATTGKCVEPQVTPQFDLSNLNPCNIVFCMNDNSRILHLLHEGLLSLLGKVLTASKIGPCNVRKQLWNPAAVDDRCHATENGSLIMGGHFVKTEDFAALEVYFQRKLALVSALDFQFGIDPTDKLIFPELIHNWLVDKDCNAQDSSITPPTFDPTDSESCKQLFAFAAKHPRKKWVVKHTVAHSGLGVALIDDFTHWARQMKLNCSMPKGTKTRTVVQEYIHGPQQQTGHSLSLEVYVLILSTDPWLVFWQCFGAMVHPEMATNFDAWKPHKRPEEDELMYKQLEFDQKEHEQRKKVSYLTLIELLQTLGKHGSTQMPQIQRKLQQGIQRAVQIWFLSLKSKVHRHPGTWGMYRLDFVLDQQLETYLVDVNQKIVFDNREDMRIMIGQAAQMLVAWHTQGKLGCSLAFGQHLRNSDWQVAWDERWGVDFVDPADPPPCPSGPDVNTFCECGAPKLRTHCVKGRAYSATPCLTVETVVKKL